MYLLHNLSAVCTSRLRRGRGGARGGTSGRGHKGQNARSGGGVPLWYEGGQMPYLRRLPKRGFNNARFARKHEEITLSMLERAFAEGETVDRQALVQRGCIAASSRRSCKLLATGHLSKKLTVVLDACSASARAALENLGGEVRLTGE